MTGDCSTCDHSLSAFCTDQKGQVFLHSDLPLPCPAWTPAGDVRKSNLEQWTRSRCWPFEVAA